MWSSNRQCSSATRRCTIRGLPSGAARGGRSVDSWNAILGPEKLPEPIAREVAQAALDALKMPDVQKRYQDLGGRPWGTTPEEAAAFIAEERARWRAVIQAAKVTLD